MISFVSRRFIHISHMSISTARSSALGKLRKSTGYSVSNCKKALEMFPDDVAKAEEWLHAEAKQKGWSKWAKIQTRSATQGLVGTFSNNGMGVMIEVNCETDFVSKNVEFHQLVEKILSSCINSIPHSKPSQGVTKMIIEEPELNNLQINQGTVGELVNSAISKFNEKTVAKRAIVLKVAEDLRLSSLSHPNNLCSTLQGASLGKYGALLAYKPTADSCTENLAQSVCQHIIGLSPSTVGQLTEQDIQDFSREKTRDGTAEFVGDGGPECKSEDNASEKSDDANEQDESEEQESVTADVEDPDEARLLFQTFLLDPHCTVGEVTHRNGLGVVDFERFECGQTQTEGGEVKEAERAVA